MLIQALVERTSWIRAGRSVVAADGSRSRGSGYGYRIGWVGPLALMVALAGSASAVYADARSDAKQQVEFGIKVAQVGLWNEAAYRWKKAVEIDPTYAAAWNNLAIAYEQQGDFEKANEAYEKAVDLDPDNLMIRQNYDLFKEINDRTKRRRDS